MLLLAIVGCVAALTAAVGWWVTGRPAWSPNHARHDDAWLLLLLSRRRWPDHGHPHGFPGTLVL